MYRHSNQCGQMDDINQIALKNFKDAHKIFLKTEFENKEDRLKAFQDLLTYHQNNQVVKNDQLFVDLWLKMAKIVQDPEEVYVYMHVVNIGKGNVYFYKQWIQLYQKRKQYILAYQLLQQTKKFFKEYYYNKTIEEMKKRIQKRIAEDYLQKTPNFIHASQDYEGISQKDFQILNDLTIEKRINEIEAQIFGIWTGSKNYNLMDYNRSKRRSGMSVEDQQRKRYSDLINMKNVSGESKNGIYFYIEEQYRQNFISEIELLVYEVSYYDKKYYNINPSGSENFIKKNNKIEFWLKQPKFKLCENEEEEIQKFLRISNAVAKEKKVSTRLQQNYHNSPKPTKKRSSYFECKRNLKKKFQFHETKTSNIDFQQISTQENLDHLDMDQQIGVFDYQYLFDESNSSLNCQQRLGRPDKNLITDNIISELPRNNRKSFFENQFILNLVNFFINYFNFNNLMNYYVSLNIINLKLFNFLFLIYSLPFQEYQLQLEVISNSTIFFFYKYFYDQCNLQV